MIPKLLFINYLYTILITITSNYVNESYVSLIQIYQNDPQLI